MDAVMMNASSEKGFSMIETVMSIGVLAVGVLGTAGAMATGMSTLGTSTANVVMSQKAAQAIEAVFAARDSHKLTWAQIKNIKGATGSDNGVFLDGPQPMHLSGPDGLVNTDDDTRKPIESSPLPGRDQVLGTADDTTTTLNDFTREIVIRDVPSESGELRSITVTIRFKNATGPTRRPYTLTTYISAYS
jgi:Tfp pilus assembly protein PilV